MRLLIVAVCFLGLAVAAPSRNGGDREKAGNDKDGSPFKALVDLCVDRALRALEADGADAKRSFDEIFEGPLKPICESILLELEKNEAEDEDDLATRALRNKQKGNKRPPPEKLGSPPTGSPPTRNPPTGNPPTGKPRRPKSFNGDWDKKGRVKFGDSTSRPKGNERPPPEKLGSKPPGSPPTGTPLTGPPPKRRPTRKPEERAMSKDGSRPKPNDAVRLLRICKGFAELAEKEEKRAFEKEFWEGLMDDMEAVCGLALIEAESLKTE